MLPLFYCVIITAAWISAGMSTDNIPRVVIEPNQLYCNQKLTDGQSVHYYVTKLQMNTGYEFRVSYPAVMPTDFIIKDLNKTTSTGRKLLNIEKLAFWTNLEEEKHFEVTIFRTGVPVRLSLKDLPVTYDVVVEQLFVNVPIKVWKLVFMVLVTLLLVLKFCHQPFVNYINDENEKVE